MTYEFMIYRRDLKKTVFSGKTLKELNALGQQGWRIVAVCRDLTNNGEDVFLQRDSEDVPS